MHTQPCTIISPATPAEWQAYYNLRYEVLRKPWDQNPGSEQLPDDAQAINAMVLDESQEVIGAGRVHIGENYEAQIRKMAVAPQVQGQGVGRLLMQWLEQQAIAAGAKTVMLHAREHAVPFYEKMGYQVIEKSHVLFGLIQHYRMLKQL